MRFAALVAFSLFVPSQFSGLIGKTTFTPHLSKVFEWARYFDRAGLKDEDAEEIRRLQLEARRFLEGFDWCKRVLEQYVGFVYPGIVGVFLFRFEPVKTGGDEWTWVIVGDLLPAYISCIDAPNPATALDAYAGAMEDWIDAAQGGKSTRDLIPVNVPATAENAQLLKKRLDLLDRHILSGYQRDLQERGPAIG